MFVHSCVIIYSDWCLISRCQSLLIDLLEFCLYWSLSAIRQGQDWHFGQSNISVKIILENEIYMYDIEGVWKWRKQICLYLTLDPSCQVIGLLGLNIKIQFVNDVKTGVWDHSNIIIPKVITWLYESCLSFQSVTMSYVSYM